MCDTNSGHVISRRQALSLFTAPIILGLAGCSSNDPAEDDPMVGACVAQPQLAEGPFFVDTGLMRTDIREGKEGALMQLNIKVMQVGTDVCTPIEQALVDIWHTDANGDYSGVQGLEDQQFLRGMQTTDADGNVSFTTIYPGWYPGRAVHIHFKVRSSATSTSAYEFTSQLFFDDNFSRQIYQQAPYDARGEQNTTNDSDGIFGQSGNQLMLAIEEIDDRLVASFEVGLLIG